MKNTESEIRSFFFSWYN